MKLYVTITLKSGARLVGDLQEESIEVAARKLEKSFTEPVLRVGSGQDAIVAATGEIAAFQISPNKP